MVIRSFDAHWASAVDLRLELFNLKQKKLWQDTPQIFNKFSSEWLLKTCAVLQVSIETLLPDADSPIRSLQNITRESYSFPRFLIRLAASCSPTIPLAHQPWEHAIRSISALYSHCRRDGGHSTRAAERIPCNTVED
ncbi:hypothetical protein EVAR_33696_1 [Eumeta japonica]|uniref:Uncharacterized protein n=1 Tax=Eumeta variegata TaxID=151549 RepID=A0A4C1VNL6_EUMVA|nr:hypothetical protein EVAR_33696_1 [Eumeta japonica]